MKFSPLILLIDHLYKSIHKETLWHQLRIRCWKFCAIRTNELLLNKAVQENCCLTLADVAGHF